MQPYRPAVPGRILAAPDVLLEHALAYAARGWPVFPCRGKEPLTPHGLKDATCNADTIRAWLRRWPRDNIAIRTGDRSGLLVLDPDGEEGEESLRRLERQHEPLPTTPEVLTGGGGRHLYFQQVPGLRNTAKRLGPGIDTRAEGGYVIAPPSTHPVTGRRYEWSVDGHPDEVALAPLPAWLRDALQPAAKAAAASPSEWRAFINSTVAEGRRNDAVARLAGHLLRRYVNPFIALELIRAWNLTRCQPPLSDDEVIRTVSSIANRELARRRARQ